MILKYTAIILYRKQNNLKLQQIIRGTKNVSQFGEEVEFMAPFVCVMACVVARKYSILSWTPEIVDYILKCGVELYSASKFRYDQVRRHDSITDCH